LLKKFSAKELTMLKLRNGGVIDLILF